MTLRVTTLNETTALEKIRRCHKCRELELSDPSEISLTPTSAPLRHTRHVAKGVCYDCAECNGTSVVVSYLSIRGKGAAEAPENWRGLQAGARSYYEVDQRFIDGAAVRCVIEEWSGTPFVIHRAHFMYWDVTRSEWKAAAAHVLEKNDQFIRATWDVRLHTCVTETETAKIGSGSPTPAALQAGADRLRQLLGQGESGRPTLPASPAPRQLPRDTSALRRLLKS